MNQFNRSERTKHFDFQQCCSLALLIRPQLLLQVMHLLLQRGLIGLRPRGIASHARDGVPVGETEVGLGQFNDPNLHVTRNHPMASPLSLNSVLELC